MTQNIASHQQNVKLYLFYQCDSRVIMNSETSNQILQF